MSDSPGMPSKVVFDCNVYLQALGNPSGPAGRCLQAAFDGHFRLIVDQLLLVELDKVSVRPKMLRKLHLLSTRVERLIEELRVKAIYVDQVPQEFTYQRDPDDAHYVNLAIATGAWLVVSRDLDLLELMNDDNPDGVRLRAKHADFRVIAPTQLLKEIQPLTGEP